MPVPNRHTVPAMVRPQFEEVVGLLENVCRAHLTKEYAAVARELAAALARKRPSPLLRGQSRTWAGGITYTIGSVNFLFDPTQRPHVRASDLCALFDVSQSAGAAKSREIMRVVNIVPHDLDPLGPADLTFERDGLGRLGFLAIQAGLDYRVGKRDGGPTVEFSFEGSDEGDRITGRGWATLAVDELRGRIFIHHGDDSGFTARRCQRAAPRRKRTA